MEWGRGNKSIIYCEYVHSFVFRKGKQSVRPDRFGVDDIFKKFSIPSRDFFEDEFFASDWKRHRLIEEVCRLMLNIT